MKRLLLLFLTGALLTAAESCDREPCAECAEAYGQHRVTLRLSGNAAGTKVLDVPSLAEGNVVCSNLFVFDRNGMPVGSYRSADGDFDFYLPEDVYDFVAVVNKGDLPGAAVSKAELLGSVTTLAENAPGNFVMVGRLDGCRIDSDENLTVEVARRVAKVSYTIRTAFPARLADAGFRVDKIYLTNVAGSCLLDERAGSSENVSQWYNKMDLESMQEEAPYDLLSGYVGREMAPSDLLTSGHVFYPYPNDAADSHDRQRWSSRCTRFVVQAELGGRMTWYPVTIDSILGNRHYHIDLTISNYGVDHPEDRLDDLSAVRISVEAAAWSEGVDLEEVF